MECASTSAGRLLCFAKGPHCPKPKAWPLGICIPVECLRVSNLECQASDEQVASVLPAHRDSEPKSPHRGAILAGRSSPIAHTDTCCAV